MEIEKIAIYVTNYYAEHTIRAFVITIIGAVIAGVILFGIQQYYFNNQFEEKIKNQEDRAFQQLLDGNYEESVSEYEGILDQISNSQNSMRYVRININLGVAYYRLSKLKDPEENLKHSLYALDQAEKSIDKNKDPYNFALVQENKINTFNGLSNVREQEKNLESALSSGNLAKDIFSPIQYPEDYAETQINIGATYQELSEIKNTSENQQKSLDAFNEALKTSKNPDTQAQAKMGIGNVYLSEKKISNVTNLHIAIDSYEEALQFYTPEAHLYDFLTCEMNLGIAYSELASFQEENENLKKSITTLKKALNHLSIQENHFEYATAHNSIGNSYQLLARINDTDIDSQNAINSYNESLRVFTLKEYPQKYGMIQNNLGAIFSELAIKKNDIQYYEKANEAYDNAILGYSNTNYSLIYSDIRSNRIFLNKKMYNLTGSKIYYDAYQKSLNNS